MIIDFHTHIFKKNVIKKKQDYLNDKFFAFLYSAKAKKMADHVILLQSMSESGVDRAVVMGFPWEKEKYCDEQNQYFRDAMNISGGRIIPFGSVPLKKGTDFDGRIKEIKDMGLAGIGEIAFYTDGMTAGNEKVLRKIVESAGIHSLPVNIHVSEPVGHNYPGKYNSNLAALCGIIRDYPGTQIILAHWGGGLFFYELMPEIRESFKNVYYDTAASPFLYSDDIYDIAIKVAGPEKILFGSDFPLIKSQRYLESIKKCVKSPGHIRDITGKNAARILKMKG